MSPPVRPGAHLVVLRGGGDLATGVAWRLSRAGFPIVVLELAEPLTVRRTVALSSAVTDRVVDVEGLVGRRVETPGQAVDVTRRGEVAVLVSPELAIFPVAPSVVVDARLAKRNLDTRASDAPMVVGLGPGFTAGADCHAVVETARGHRLGRVLWSGSAAPDTGTPGLIEGKGVERVLRAPVAGRVAWQRAIGDVVDEGTLLGTVGETAHVRATFRGVVRGLILEGRHVEAGTKIGDLDPRADPSLCREISDKSLAIGGGVLEAVLTWLGEDRR